MNGIMRLASDDTVIVCRKTFPGPVNVVKNNPSPPNRIFLKPFTISAL
jgi:hypothetical protein